MDGSLVRTRYFRRSIPRKARRKSSRETVTLLESVVRQLFFSAIILLFIVTIKNINTPFTNFLTDKIRVGILQNVEISSIYEGIDKMLKSVPGTKSTNKNDTGFQNDAVPVSGKVYTFEELRNETAAESGINGDREDSNEKNLEPAEKEDPKTNLKAPGPLSQRSTKYSFTSPAEGFLGSPFGERLDPFTKILKFHKGIDIEANKGAQIKAALDGEVVESGVEKTYGNYIRLSHADGFTTTYAHCSQLIAKKGQKVKQGDIIAKVGDTGSSIGAHLHFEISKDGKPVNPLEFIKVSAK